MAQFVEGKEVQSTLEDRWRCVSTGSQQIDKMLGGGIPTRGITELSGQSGCGKTQLCLQLAITVQFPLSSGGLDSGALFICTEDRFPSVRLHQIIKSSSAAQQFPNVKFGDNIFIEHVADSAELLKCVTEQLPQVVRQRRIGLIVVDSVAAVFRVDYSPAEAIQRARDLRALAFQLHNLANIYHIAVVCINQVTDVKKGNQSITVPALGLAWANLVTCRLQMFRHNSNRRLHVIFSPHLPQQCCNYNITTKGVEGC